MRNQRGFTLMEVLVSIAIMAVLGTALTALLRSSMSAWREGEARAGTNATAQAALEQIAGDFAAACTKPVRPPGPVVIEIPTVEHLLKHRIDYYSNEWCTVSVDPPLRIIDKLYAASLPAFIGQSRNTFDFQLRFPAKRAAAWVAASGEIDLEAKIYTPDNEDDDTGWQPLPESGDLSTLIADASEEGTDHIGIRATFRNTKARLMPGTEGPVLRFVAEPNKTAIGTVRFLLNSAIVGTPGVEEPQRVVFVRNFGGKTDPFAPAGSNAARSLGEVCYITTADTDADGKELPGRTLWRTVRQPVGDWSEYQWGYPGNEGDSSSTEGWLYERHLMDEIGTLYDHVRLDGKVDRQAMANLGFHPIADNVLHFSVEAWRDDPEYPGWVDTWPPEAGTPRKIRIILTLIPRTGPTVARLTRELGAESTTAEIEIESTAGFRPYAANSAFERFLKIGDEWVHYDNIKGNKLLFDERDFGDDSSDAGLLRLLSDPNRPLGNRGLHGTAISDHIAGTDVYQGESYVRTIILPYPRQIETEEEPTP